MQGVGAGALRLPAQHEPHEHCRLPTRPYINSISMKEQQYNGGTSDDGADATCDGDGDGDQDYNS